ncbi:MAG: cytochrome c [Nitrospirae bacterium]|nr:cytochrome c [Nitrospirota bacterium]
MKNIGKFLLTVGAILTPAIANAADKKGNVEEGKKLYAQFCSNCHGAMGKGDGPAAAVLNPKPADHSDAAKMCEITDDILFKVIKDGGASIGKSPVMPAWGPQLKDDQKVQDLVAFVRSLNVKGCKGKAGGGDKKKEPEKKK